MAELDEIMGFFHQIVETGKELRLVNEYKGIPISFAANIIEIGRSSIRIKTEKYQIVCLYKERFTYLSSNFLPRNITARVILLDVGKMEAILSKFAFAGSGVGQRNQVRVEPETAIDSIIRAETLPLSIAGELADISQDGLGIYVNQSDYYPEIHRRGVAVRVYIKLPLVTRISGRRIDMTSLPKFEVAANFDSYSPISYETRPDQREYPTADVSGDYLSHTQDVVVHGTIVNIRAELYARRQRLGIRINEKDPSRALITRFITRRQAELTREIKSIYEMIASENKNVIT